MKLQYHPAHATFLWVEHILKYCIWVAEYVGEGNAIYHLRIQIISNAWQQPCYSWCSALRMSRGYITPRTRSEELSLESKKEVQNPSRRKLHAGICLSPKSWYLVEFQASLSYARYHPFPKVFSLGPLDQFWNIPDHEILRLEHLDHYAGNLIPEHHADTLC